MELDHQRKGEFNGSRKCKYCLLYTSDAADEEDSVDLGGRRIIKKNILNGIAYVQYTFNNTMIAIAEKNGNEISWAADVKKGFKGSRKSTPYAAQIAADAAA